ncbi:MAG: phosphoenolpyruvate synthase [Pseudomonadota bacterium]
MTDQAYVIRFEELRMTDVDKVGGKNASLGEMISQLGGKGVSVPGGFATTARAYRDFLEANDLRQRIRDVLAGLDSNDTQRLAEVGAEIRGWITDAPFHPELEAALKKAYNDMMAEHDHTIEVAVRSSATAEDLPDASFAGQQETYLNVSTEEDFMQAMKGVYASLYNDRAISYRIHQGFDHDDVALSAGVQRMVRSDIGSSGVIFTLDTESGFRDVVFITGAWGLGETVVQGSVNPDEFYVHKPTLDAGHYPIVARTLGEKAIRMVYLEEGTDAEGHATRTEETPKADRTRFCINDEDVASLARMAVTIEKHYGRPMDIEWGKDGRDGRLFILQARPETVRSQETGQSIQRYAMKERGEVLITGRAIGDRIGAGRLRLVESPKEMHRVEPGDILVTDMTDPDWEPIMKRASAIVTNRGGRTCHAAIIARELGIPAVVGATGATEALKDGEMATVSCAEGDSGYVYKGELAFEVKDVSLETMPELPFKVMMNVGNPERAFSFQFLPNAGVGLARLEFIINRMIGIHPKALLNYDDQTPEIRATIDERIAGYDDGPSFYIDRLAEGIGTLAAAFWPKPVIVRMSDFKSNEYANLVGGERYEPSEENPMLGFRGASRYISDAFRPCFELEVKALRKVRETMGLTNVEVMIPFVRTVAEGKGVVDLLAENGLRRGDEGLRIIMMCEIPSNALLADQFLEHFDGFSIGSNDLTQLTLGLDRDSGLVAEAFDERDPAVKTLLHMAIQACRKADKYIGICGQGPSDYPDLAAWLMEEGITSVSLNPDSVVDTWLYLANHVKE